MTAPIPQTRSISRRYVLTHFAAPACFGTGLMLFIAALVMWADYWIESRSESTAPTVLALASFLMFAFGAHLMDVSDKIPGPVHSRHRR